MLEREAQTDPQPIQARRLGTSLVARVRRLLRTDDRAVPTMELSLALDISAQLASRLLALIEGAPTLETLTAIRGQIARPTEELERAIVHASSWDEAVSVAEETGLARPDARAVVDWVIIDMALEAYLTTAQLDLAVLELAELAGITSDSAQRLGVAATLRKVIGTGRVDRLAATRAFVMSAALGFGEAFVFGDALASPRRRDALVEAGARIDAGDCEGAVGVLVDRLGTDHSTATDVVEALARGFHRCSWAPRGKTSTTSS